MIKFNDWFKAKEEIENHLYVALITLFDKIRLLKAEVLRSFNAQDYSSMFFPKSFFKNHPRLFGPALIILFPFFAPNLFAAPPTLMVSGNQLQANGSCVFLKGVDQDGLEFSSTGEGPPGGNGGNTLTVSQMAVTGWHCTIIRLPLDQDYWFGCQAANQANYRGYVSSVVNYCAGQNVYVLLDLHWSGQAGTASAPCGTGWGNAKTQQPMADANAVTFWSSVAAAYANNSAVLFDLYNEPYDQGNDNISPPVTDTNG